MEVKQKVSTKVSPVNLARPPASSKDQQREGQRSSEVSQYTRDTLGTLREPRGSATTGPCCLNPAESKARVPGGDGPGSLPHANRVSEQTGGGPMWTWAQQTLLVWTHFRRPPLHPLSSASPPSPPGPSVPQGAAQLLPCAQPRSHVPSGALPPAHPLSPREPQCVKVASCLPPPGPARAPPHKRSGSSNWSRVPSVCPAEGPTSLKDRQSILVPGWSLSRYLAFAQALDGSQYWFPRGQNRNDHVLSHFPGSPGDASGRDTPCQCGR